MRSEALRAEQRFAAALFDGQSAPPPCLWRAGSARARSGFGVHRNNVAASLGSVLAARFPAIVRLIGDEAFASLALRFVVQCPPRTPVLIDYGTAFPEFLHNLSGSVMAAYLADIARLELARGRAYHAADAEPLTPHDFARLTPETLAGLRMMLHPSLTLLRSRFPVVSAWEASQPDGPAAIRCWCAEDAMVLRPYLDVQVVRLPAGGVSFLSALSAGATLGEAIAQAACEHGGFDLTENLAQLAGSAVVVRIA